MTFAATTPHEFIITGDFNIHLDNPTDHLISQFLSLLSSFNLTQHVDFPTHNKNHILDLVITSSACSLAPSLSSSHCCPSDHFPVFTRLSINPIPLPPPTLHSFRWLHSIDIGSFLTDLKSSRLVEQLLFHHQVIEKEEKEKKLSNYTIQHSKTKSIDKLSYI